MSKTSTKFAIKSNILTQVLLVPLGLLNSVLINRALGVDLKGQYYFISLLVTFIAPLLLAGVNGSLHYHLANKSYTKEQIFTRGLTFNLLIAFLAIAMMLGLHRIGYLGAVGSSMETTLMILGVGSVFPYLLFTFFSSILQSEMRYHSLNVLNILALAVTVLANGIAILLLDGSLTLLILVYGAVNILKAIWSGRLAWSRLDVKEVNPVMSRDIHGYGLKIWLNGILSTTNQRIDSFLVGVLLNSSSLGIYSVGFNLTNYFTMLPNTFLNVLFTRMTSERSESKRRELEALQHRILVFYCIVTGILNWFFIEYVISFLYGAEFSESAEVAKYLFFGVSAYLLSRPIMKYNSSVGKPLLNTYGQGLGALFSVVFFLVLIPEYSFMGAVIASVMGYFVTYFLVVLIARKRFHFAAYFLFSLKDVKLLTNTFIRRK